ncbi:MAG TPA: hypothetical protein VFN48_06565 [Solirubrobacteraceae bacterium]|nr:hypothetical protein [Solirubrobacteraceae bacterium]
MAVLIVAGLLGLPALARAATVTTPLTPTAPPWLTQTTPAAAGAAVPVSSHSAAPLPTGNLPYTGDNLLPEAIAAGGLLLGGVALRLRLR